MFRHLAFLPDDHRRPGLPGSLDDFGCGLPKGGVGLLCESVPVSVLMGLFSDTALNPVEQVSVHSRQASRVLPGDQRPGEPGGVIKPPAITALPVQSEQVSQTRCEPSPHVSLGNRMPPLTHPTADPEYGQVGTWEPEEEQGDPVTIPLQPGQEAGVGAAREGCLEPEIFPGRGEFADPLQQEPTSLHVLGLRGER